jgi:hypothetical protein
MTMEADAPGVAILDRVTLPRSAAGPWIDRLHREYGPSAEARGLAFAGMWQTGAEDAETVEIVVLWTLPGPREFFGSRATSHEASAWWRETDSIALHRERRVMHALDAP